MFPIRCDHRRGFWPFSWQCRAEATKHLLHHPKNGYGDDPQVLLLCPKHFLTAIEVATARVAGQRLAGNGITLSQLIKDTGNI